MFDYSVSNLTTGSQILCVSYRSITYAAKRGAVGAKAYSLLRANDAITESKRDVFLPADNKNLRTGTVSGNISEGLLELFPNPADHYVTVDFRIDRVFRNAELNLIDSQGKVVYSIELVEQKNQRILEIDLPAGSYRCVIMVDGKDYKTNQLVVE